MMIHAVLLAALTCGMRSTVESADALLSKADTAIAQHSPETAKSDYGSAMSQLQATQWLPSDKRCDPRYTLERYTAILHSLNVAMNAGIMTPFDAYKHMNDMHNGLFNALPPNASEFFAQKYPELSKREWQYTSAIDASVNAQKVAAHNPQGLNCQPQNVDADVFGSSTTRLSRCSAQYEGRAEGRYHGKPVSAGANDFRYDTALDRKSSAGPGRFRRRASVHVLAGGKRLQARSRHLPVHRDIRIRPMRRR